MRLLSASFSTVAFLAIGGSALAQSTPTVVITSTAGPLTLITIGNEGSAQIEHIGDAPDGEFYPPLEAPGDSGTFILLNGILYAPDFHHHGTGQTATGNLGTFTPLTPVSQSTVTGTGTPAQPYRVVTVYRAGTTGIQVSQTDVYVKGQESYGTSMSVSNTGTVARSFVLYRAGDCYLGSSDSGYGFVDPVTGSVACTKNANNTPPGRVEQLLPISPGSHYLETGYGSVWQQIGSHMPFMDTCDCTTNEDNGEGLSWAITLQPGQSTQIALVTTFSSIGILPVTTAKAADTATVTQGSMDGYTITLNNSNTASVAIATITDTLPMGFAYLPRSTTGTTTLDPQIGGQTLTWNGPFTIGARSRIALHFLVTVSTATGAYYNNAAGTAVQSITVTATGDTARIGVILGRPDASVPDVSAFDGGIPDGSGSDDSGPFGTDAALGMDTMEGLDAIDMGDANDMSDASAGVDTLGGGSDAGGHGDAAKSGDAHTFDAGNGKNNSGCGCATSDRSPRSGALAFALLAALWIARKRRDA
jgi:uncharacterized repeat protein (TIGR01451 family)/MYXO-CTERM domain-containing protein